MGKGWGALVFILLIDCSHLKPLGEVDDTASGAIEVEQKVMSQLFRVSPGIDGETSVRCGGNLLLNSGGRLVDCSTADGGLKESRRQVAPYCENDPGGSSGGGSSGGGSSGGGSSGGGSSGGGSSGGGSSGGGSSGGGSSGGGSSGGGSSGGSSGGRSAVPAGEGIEVDLGAVFEAYACGRGGWVRTIENAGEAYWVRPRTK